MTKLNDRLSELLEIITGNKPPLSAILDYTEQDEEKGLLTKWLFKQETLPAWVQSIDTLDSLYNLVEDSLKLQAKASL